MSEIYFYLILLNNLDVLRKGLDLFSENYEYFFILGSINIEFSAYCESCSLNSLVKEPTCFENPENPSCINLILTNSPNS